MRREQAARADGASRGRDRAARAAGADGASGQRERGGDVSAGVGTDRGTTGARASVGSAGHARECRCAGDRPEVRRKGTPSGRVRPARLQDKTRTRPGTAVRLDFPRWRVVCRLSEAARRSPVGPPATATEDRRHNDRGHLSPTQGPTHRRRHSPSTDTGRRRLLPAAGVSGRRERGRERAARMRRAGGASWRRERAARRTVRADGASWRRERTVRDGRCERTARVGDARGGGRADGRDGG